MSGESSSAREAESHPESSSASEVMPSVPPPSGAASSGVSGAAPRRSQRSADEDSWEMVQVRHPHNPLAAHTAHLLNDSSIDCVCRLFFTAICNGFGIKPHSCSSKKRAEERSPPLVVVSRCTVSQKQCQYNSATRSSFSSICLALLLALRQASRRVLQLWSCSPLAGQTECCMLTARMPSLIGQIWLQELIAIKNEQLHWRIPGGTHKWWC